MLPNGKVTPKLEPPQTKVSDSTADGAKRLVPVQEAVSSEVTVSPAVKFESKVILAISIPVISKSSNTAVCERSIAWFPIMPDAEMEALSPVIQLAAWDALVAMRKRS